MLATLPVSEIFGPTIQGEGALAGYKTMFIRLMGCDYQCSWCDTKFTWHKDHLGTFERLTAGQILDQLEQLTGGKYSVHDHQRLWVTISGGNPALHDLTYLVRALKDARYRVAVETQGSVVKDWMSFVDCLTLSPKPPSSGMLTQSTVLRECIKQGTHWGFPGEPPRSVVKVVVFDEEDYQYAKAIYRLTRDVDSDVPFYLQVGTELKLKDNLGYSGAQILGDYEMLVAKVIADPELSDVAVLPQIHTLLWGQKRGV